MTEQTLLKKIGRIADEHGWTVYAVGGYVRDHLLKKQVKDIDFVVIGEGPQFARLVASQLKTRQIVVFEKFGTAMINFQDYRLEFVTARTESYLETSRKPIVAQADLDGDLRRRDFTINALALGLNRNNFGRLYDPLGGRQDLQNKIIRTPLDPVVTFKDDPLRIMRAVRFATQLNFDIEKRTFEALKEMRQRLSIISQERITDELIKILLAPRPSRGFQLLDQAEILDIIFPELVAMKGVEQRGGYHHKDVFQHTLMVVDNVAKVSAKLELRFAALVHDIGKPATKRFVEGTGWTFHGHDEIGARMLPAVCQRLRLPNHLMEYAQKLTRLHLRPINLSEEGVTDSPMRRLLAQAGEHLEDLLTLCRADITSGNPQRVKQHLANFDHVVERLNEVEAKDQMRAFQSPVRGDEIMAVCGIPPGPLVGKLKSMIEEAILDAKIPNEHDAALQYLLQIKDEVIREGVNA
ncbi:MAG: CCA tRNA nucleotidyltransferase [candidate division KSB1 bacterium]|nr:CCA tRNA nucleotidyltransferase [candidate division KSB1 bacterium]